MFISKKTGFALLALAYVLFSAAIIVAAEETPFPKMSCSDRIRLASTWMPHARVEFISSRIKLGKTGALAPFLSELHPLSKSAQNQALIDLYETIFNLPIEEMPRVGRMLSDSKIFERWEGRGFGQQQVFLPALSHLTAAALAEGETAQKASVLFSSLSFSAVPRMRELLESVFCRNLSHRVKILQLASQVGESLTRVAPKLIPKDFIYEQIRFVHLLDDMAMQEELRPHVAVPIILFSGLIREHFPRPNGISLVQLSNEVLKKEHNETNSDVPLRTAQSLIREHGEFFSESALHKAITVRLPALQKIISSEYSTLMYQGPPIELELVDSTSEFRQYLKQRLIVIEYNAATQEGILISNGLSHNKLRDFVFYLTDAKRTGFSGTRWTMENAKMGTLYPSTKLAGDYRSFARERLSFNLKAITN